MITGEIRQFHSEPGSDGGLFRLPLAQHAWSVPRSLFLPSSFTCLDHPPGAHAVSRFLQLLVSNRSMRVFRHSQCGAAAVATDLRGLDRAARRVADLASAYSSAAISEADFYSERLQRSRCCAPVLAERPGPG